MSGPWLDALYQMSVGEGLGGRPTTGAFELGRPALGARGWLVARQGWLGLAGMLVTSLVVCLSAAQTSVLLPASVRPVPSWLAGPFGGAGVSLGLVGMIAVFALMFVSAFGLGPLAIRDRVRDWLTALMEGEGAAVSLPEPGDWSEWDARHRR